MLQKNQIVELTVDAVTSEGSGIGRCDGFPVFLAGAAPGDTVRAHIIKAKRTYAVGKILDVLSPAPCRIASDCPISAQCGGCTFRHMRYEAELEEKWERVRDALRRIGHLDCVVQAIVPAADTAAYRNKAQYQVRREQGKTRIGFYAPRSHRVIDCPGCRLQPEEFNHALQVFRTWMEEYEVSAYEESSHTGLIRCLYLRKGFATGEMMACVVVNGRELPHWEALLHQLRREIPNLVSLQLNCNRRETNVILGGETHVLWGRDAIEDTLLGMRLRISPHAFYQVNHAQTEQLYRLAGEAAGLTGRETVLDLYCGTGTIGLSMAKGAGQIIGLESVPQAVEDARENAKRNGIFNAQFHCADAAEGAQMLEQNGIRPDVIVLDPPRKGCDAQLIGCTVRMRPDRIVYISCDPATLARDLALFQQQGYTVRRVTPVDLFPRTAHVETVVLLSHKTPDSHINVTVEFGEGKGKVPLDEIAERAEVYKPKERVIYKMIKEYIEAKYGFEVHTAYIAAVKRELGLPMYDAPNAVEELKHPRKHLTDVQVKAIKDALKHFGVVA